MDAVLIVVIVLVIIVIAVVVAGISAYNGLIKNRNVIQESWRQVDVELQRRHELLPNLVETVRGFAAHERNTLEDVTRLRNQAASLRQAEPSDSPTTDRTRVEEELTGAVHNLLVSVEAYPELRSNENFLHLQRQLSETEDRIAAGRRYYNANVRVYNTKVESIPTNIIANMMNFQKATYFEVTDPGARRAPDVNFGEIAYRDETPAVGQTGPAPAAEQLPNAQAEPQQVEGRTDEQGQPGR
ncbi:LemA family protein [Propionibacteriaceae bacterium Y2011]|uniref:LemA family protein n=1 Tax=Microlunatus sp. Y2014 TaxID=3418488 RepID=UPI003B48AE6D